MDVKPVPYCKQVTCDRCGLTCSSEDEGFLHFLSLDLQTGWGSPFGDGVQIDLDICHGCLKETLGQWLQLSDAAWNGGPRRIGFLKGRIMKGSEDWQAFLESDQTISEDFMNAVFADRKPLSES